MKQWASKKGHNCHVAIALRNDERFAAILAMTRGRQGTPKAWQSSGLEKSNFKSIAHINPPNKGSFAQSTLFFSSLDHF